MRVENRFYLTVRRKSCKVKDKLQRMLYKSMCDKNKNKKTITNRFVTGHKMGSTTRGVFFFMSFFVLKNRKRGDGMKVNGTEIVLAEGTTLLL